LYKRKLCKFVSPIFVNFVILDDRRDTPRAGSKRPFRDIENPTEETSIVLIGRSVERNKYLTIKPEGSAEGSTPKIGHVLGKHKFEKIWVYMYWVYMYWGL